MAKCRLLILAALLLLLVSAGCAARDTKSEPDPLQAGVREYTLPDGHTVYFPRQAPAEGSMAALLQGILIEENGCLRVKSMHGPGSSLVIWRADHRIDPLSESVEVLNGDSDVIARIGEPISLGGGEANSIEESLQVENCPGPYWIAGEDAPPPAVSVLEEIFYAESGTALLRQGLAVYQWALTPSNFTGTITEQNHCLRINNSEGESYVIILPPGAAFSYESGEMAIAIPSTAHSGWEPLFAPGQQATLAGAEVSEEASPQLYELLQEALPSTLTCPGPFWIVSW